MPEPLAPPESPVATFDPGLAGALQRALGPSLFERATLFPLHPLRDTPEGVRCGCRKPNCSPQNAGKHPAILWNPDSHPDGSKVLPADGGGMGIATGSRSGGLVVIDIDMGGARDKNGLASLQELEQVYGPLPPTLTVESPSGGRHLYFLAPAERFKTQAQEMADGIDIKGEGGYAVIPGSPHRKGGHYRVTAAHPPAPLPAQWAQAIPKAGALAGKGTVVPDRIVGVPSADLRQHLADTARGGRSDLSRALRLAVRGERMFRLDAPDAPGDPDLPTVPGVDVWLTQTLIWGLASSTAPGGLDWFRVPAQDVALLFAPSLSILRSDAQEVGTPSKWTADHFAGRWETAAGKVAAARAESEAFVATLEQAASEAAAPGGLPFVLQLDDRYWVLDDRDPAAPVYQGPTKGVALIALAGQVWYGKGRPLEVEEGKAGTRPMVPSEVVAAYGRAITGLVVDYTATRPALEDLTLVRGPARPAPPPPPKFDPEVEAWLRALVAQDLPTVYGWLAWARQDRCGTSIPALTLIGGANVGKSLLADAVARTMGLWASAPLKRALGKFGSVLADSPVLFSDEGLPTSDQGRPMTEEFRALITRSAHVLEVKGSDKSLVVRGAPRIILAANSAGRLFQNRGTLNGHDVQAIMRRLLVVDIPDQDENRIREATRLAVGLGLVPGTCPRRMERVAGHVRWVQEFGAPEAPPPEPRDQNLGGELRRGRDLTQAALRALEDPAPGSTWLARHGDLLWVRPDDWARASGVLAGSGPLMRAVASYVKRGSTRFSAHPATGAPLDRRERWAALDLALLERDGVTVGTLDQTPNLG